MATREKKNKNWNMEREILLISFFREHPELSSKNSDRETKEKKKGLFLILQEQLGSNLFTGK